MAGNSFVRNAFLVLAVMTGDGPVAMATPILVTGKYQAILRTAPFAETQKPVYLDAFEAEPPAGGDPAAGCCDAFLPDDPAFVAEPVQPSGSVLVEVPEPAALSLLVAALGAAAWLRFRYRRRAA